MLALPATVLSAAENAPAIEDLLNTTVGGEGEMRALIEQESVEVGGMRVSTGIGPSFKDGRRDVHAAQPVRCGETSDTRADNRDGHRLQSLLAHGSGHCGSADAVSLRSFGPKD